MAWDSERSTGLKVHFAEQNAQHEAISRAQQIRVSRKKARDAQISANYHLDTLNPVNRYKHTHKSAPKMKPVKLSECEVEKIAMINGKRIVKLKKI